MMAGGAMADVTGAVFKRLQRLVEAMASPDWPQPSSNPAKPLTNGILTVLGLLIGRMITKRVGLTFQPRAGRHGPPGPDSVHSRPVRVVLALLGVVIPAFVAILIPLAVYGAGSKTVELVGMIVDVYFQVAIVLIVVAALFERAHDRQTDPQQGARFKQIERDIRVALVVLFLVFSAALVSTFMYPEDTTDKVARLAYVSFTALLAAALTIRYRAETGMLFSGVFGERFQRLSRTVWVVICGYILIAWLKACVLVLLNRDYALKVVLAPTLSLLVGVSVYHIILFLAGLVWQTGGEAPSRQAVAAETPDQRAPENHRMRWARHMGYATGIIAGLLVVLHQFGVSFTDASGSLGFLPTTAIVILFAYSIWSYTQLAIDHRIALERISAPGEDGGDGEGGIGQSRLATLLPLFRNAVMLTIVFLVCLILLAKAGVDITPIFASAGIVGLAIGFGAQSLVRDVISGLFFLLDDAFRLGEYIETGGVRGTVERISIRSMQLRHHNGPLNTIPFGAIREVTNYSRDWVIMKLPIKVALDTDPDRVRKLVKKLGQDLLQDPEVGDKFIDPLKSQGVLAIDNWGMTIRVKFKTLPGNQFIVRRYVYARLHDLFEREGIQFAGRDVRVRMEGPGGRAEGGAVPGAGTGPGGAVPAGAAVAAATVMDDDDVGLPADSDDRDAR